MTVQVAPIEKGLYAAQRPLFIAGQRVSAVAGEVPYMQLWNPAGSGKVAEIVSVLMSNPAGQRANFSGVLRNTELTDLGSVPYDMAGLGRVASCGVRGTTAAGSGTFDTAITRYSHTFSEGGRQGNMELYQGFLLRAGQGLTFIGESQNQTWGFAFRWLEWPA